MTTVVQTNLFHDPYGRGAYSETGVPGGGNTTANVVASGTGAGDIVTMPATGALRAPLRQMILAPSTTYTIRYRITASVSWSLTVSARPSASVGSTTGQTAITTLAMVAGVAQEISHTFTTSSDAGWTTNGVNASGLAFTAGTSTAGTLTITDITIVAGSSAAARPFDGTLASTQALAYAWLGTPYASRSTETYTYQAVGVSASTMIAVSDHGVARPTISLATGIAAYGGHSVVGVTSTLTLGITAEILPRIVGTADAVAFSYWEKRRKDFGLPSGTVVTELKPFWYQSDSVGVHVVRQVDGTFTTVETVDEALENTTGIRIYYGGKMNRVTNSEADELTAAGYGDYLTTRANTGDAFNEGAYNEGDYGA